MNTVLKSALGAAVIASVAAFGLANTANAGVITYGWGERTQFESELGQSYTENFENPAYLHGDIVDNGSTQIFSDNRMNEISQEIGFRPTGWTGSNHIVPGWLDGRAYCAGCNGSFELNLTNTSYSVNGGVFGIGLDVFPSIDTFYYASVLFADNTWIDFAIEDFVQFWGITSDTAIAKVHFGLAGHQPTKEGSFFVDDITIGSREAGNVPAPTAFLIMLIGLGGLGMIRRRMG